MFSSSSPLSTLYTETEGFTPKDSWLSGLVGKLLAFFSNPSLDSLKGIAKGLVKEDGSKISLTDNKLLEELDRDQKLAPLAAALRAVGTNEQGAQMKEELDTNPEAEGYNKETIDAYVTQSLGRLRHIFDDEGNLIGSNGEVLMGPLVIRQEDIESLKASDENLLPVAEGAVKWNDVASKTFKYLKTGQAGVAIDYANTIFAIFNKQMREKVDDADASYEDRETARAQNREVIDIFKNQLAQEFGGEGFAKAFEFVFTRGAFASETTRNAITGDAVESTTKGAIKEVTENLEETANDKGNSLAAREGAKSKAKTKTLLDSLVTDGDKYTILDLGGEIDGKKKGISKEELNYDGNKLTLTTVAKAYTRSAEVLGHSTAEKLGKIVLGMKLGETEKRDKYLANAAGSGTKKAGIVADAKTINTAADTKGKKLEDVLKKAQDAIGTIKSGGFIVPTEGDVDASDEFATTLSKKLLSLADISPNKDNREKIDDFRRKVSEQARKGNFDLETIVKELIKVSPKNKADIRDRIQSELKNEAKAKNFLNEFINHSEMVSLSSVVKAETVQDLIKSHKGLSSQIMRQPSNQALNQSSVEDIVTNPQYLADASPELALIFADPDVYKSDGKRAEMAMLGLMSLLKQNPSLLTPGTPGAKNIVKKLFAKEVKNDDTTAATIADKFSSFVQRNDFEQKELNRKFNLQEMANLAGSSVSRATYLEFTAPTVAYKREAVVAERLARMINGHTPKSSRGEIYQSVEALADHLEAAAEKLDGADFSDVRTIVTEGLNDPISEAIVKNMFFPGDDGDTVGTSTDKLNGNEAPQSVMDAAIRMRMILPRLFKADGSTSSTAKPAASKPATAEAEQAPAKQEPAVTG